MRHPKDQLASPFFMPSGMAEAERRIEEARRRGHRVLNLANLKLTTIPQSLMRLKGLESLSLRFNRLTKLPESLVELTGLRVLDLNNNQLIELPRSFGQLTGLWTLYLNNNQLIELPNSFGQLTGLQVLDLNGNDLTTLPESFGQLTRLQTLGLGSNQFTSLPKSLGQLTELQTLDLGNNQLTKLPESFGQLAKLHTLDLGNNQLTTLPESFGQLTGLRMLNLSQNQFIVLPESLRLLEELKGLFLHENSNLNLTDEMLGSGWHDALLKGATTKTPTEILNYYFTHRQAALDEGTEPLMEAKVLVLGEASVGKSSLIAALSESKRRNELEGKGTSGIVRKLWEVPVSGEQLAIKTTGPGIEKLRLNLWDFGGQEIYHSAHTLFLTRRAIYLIVISKRDNERQNNVDYWLRMAVSFGGPDAAIYVVVNKSDEKVGHPPDEEALRRKYPQLRGFFHTSCDNLEGISDARKTIVREALKLEGVSLPVARSWLAIKKILEKMPEHTLSLEDWGKLCKSKKVITPEAQKELLLLCDRLGTVRYFPTNEADPADLRETAILNPEWVTLGIYALFDDTGLKKRGGLLTRVELERILANRKYPTAQAHIIEEVMRRFDLLYDSAEQSSKRRMLIPLMLPEREPSVTWPSDGTLEFVYQYEVVPAGLVPAFIARMHNHLSFSAPAWRHGCFLDLMQCQVRVIGDAEAKQVLISVRGKEAMRREALDKVRFAFDDMHDAVENLFVKQLIPVPGRPDAEKLDYKFVRSLEWQGIEKFPTMGSKFGETIMVDVRLALDGVRGEMGRVYDETARNITAAQRIVVVNEGGKYIEKDDMSEVYTNQGDNKGIIGKQNQQSISHSYNTQNTNLSALLETLREEFENLPTTAAEIVRPYVEAMETEATKPKPNKGFLQLTKNGLTEAAKTCAEMAPSLLKAATAVADWCSEVG